jgi:hypothetical protein
MSVHADRITLASRLIKNQPICFLLKLYAHPVVAVILAVTPVVFNGSIRVFGGSTALPGMLGVIV